MLRLSFGDLAGLDKAGHTNGGLANKILS